MVAMKMVIVMAMGAQWGGNIPTMTGSSREVAPVRETSQGDAKEHIEAAGKAVEGECPREWVPVDLSQVPAGMGRLDTQTCSEDSGVKVGAQLSSIREAGLREVAVGAYHPGGNRWHEEELAAWQWFGGSSWRWRSATPSRCSSPSECHHH